MLKLPLFKEINVSYFLYEKQYLAQEPLQLKLII